MYKAANARLLLRSLSSNSASVPVNPRLASARLALSRPCGAWVGRSSGLVRAAGWSGTRPRFAGARAQIGAAAVPAVERFQRRMATQGAWVPLSVRAWGLPSGLGVVWLSRTGRGGAI